MVKIDTTTWQEYDKVGKLGELHYRKVEVIPNKEITLYPKGKIGNDGAFSAKWLFSNLKMNHDKDLFIYDFVSTDLNKDGGMSIKIVMRLDYSVQAVVETVNMKGTIMRFVMYDK